MLGRAVLLLAAATLAAGPARADYPVTDEQLTSVQAFRSSPLVSDDGSKIAYAYWQYRSPGVLLGRIQARLIDRSTRTERSMSMLPDGSISHRTWPTAISGDGRSIALLSASRLTDDAPDRGEPYLGIYLYDVARARPSFVGVAAELMPEGISSLSRDGASPPAGTRASTPWSSTSLPVR